MSLEVIASVVLAVLVLCLYVIRNFFYWKKKNVPYVRPIPIFGNIYSVVFRKQSIGEFLQNIYKSSKSPFLGFFIFDRPFLLIRDLEFIKHVLSKDFQCFINRNVTNDNPGSNFLFSMKDLKWKLLRKKFSPAFSTGKLKCMLPLMDEASDDLVKHINQVGTNTRLVDCRDVAVRYCVAAIASCVFGINPDWLQEKSTFQHMSRIFANVSFGRTTQIAPQFFAPLLVSALQMNMLDPDAADFMKGVFTKALRQRKISGEYRGDLLDILDQMGLEDDMQAVLGMQFLTSGFETTGLSIAFTLYELSLNKSVQKQLRDEIHTVCKNHQQISYEAICKMKYLDMTVKEVLRKHPVVPFLDRRCHASYKLPGTDLVVEKGTGVYISLLGLHYDETYFPNPDLFDPMRFSCANKPSIPSCAYMPFGEGLRHCIGARFGKLAYKMALIKILLNFKMDAGHDTQKKVAPQSGVLNVRFTPIQEIGF